MNLVIHDFLVIHISLFLSLSLSNSPLDKLLISAIIYRAVNSPRIILRDAPHRSTVSIDTPAKRITPLRDLRRVR